MTPYYDHAGITLYHGDCREILPGLGRFDLLLTDPPYGIGAHKPRGNTGRNRHILQKDYGEQHGWDAKPAATELLVQLIHQTVNAIVWGGNYFGFCASPCWLVWDKDNGENTYADCELAWTNLKKAVRKFRHKWHGMLQEYAGDKKEIRKHPTQKPVPLMRWCLTLVPDAEAILDPFAGSGTTLVAAKLEGRKAVGIEINERYCEIAAKRLAQGVLF